MKRFLNDVVKYYNYMVRAAKSELKTEVANSYLNWIWWILDPLFSMLTYYLIFGVVFNGKEQYFVIFLFIGLTMWNFFNKNVVQSVNMIKRNKPIVAKVYIPKYILLISNLKNCPANCLPTYIRLLPPVLSDITTAIPEFLCSSSPSLVQPTTL